MSGIIGTKVPLINGVTEQKLIITFSKQPDGMGAVSMEFSPDIVEAISPEQRGAVDVANAVMALIQQSKQEQEKDQDDGQPTIQ